MLRILGSPRRAGGPTRRETLLAGAGLFGLNLPRVLVVCVGEMGRSPKPDTAQWGRGQWSFCFPALLAGAGVRGGSVYGRSDKDAAYPADKPVSPEDLACTIYHALGIDPHGFIPDREGRLVALVDGGRPLLDLFG